MADGRKALVTGGAGFIGSHMVDRLLKLEYDVVVIDNLSNGKIKNLDSAAVFHHTDITQPATADIIQREQPDLVFHMAAQTSVTQSTQDPIADTNANVLGTLRVLEASRRVGVEKIIYSCTGGALYGDPETIPVTDDAPIAPVSPYGMSKWMAEEYLDFYYRQYRLRYTSLRYGNVFGPRQDPHGEAGVIAIFSQAMLEGKQPQIFGDGTQERDFISVFDVIDANLAAIERGDGKAMNVATGEPTSVNRMFELLQGITGYKWDPLHAPQRAGEVYRIALDWSQAAQVLGWSPKISLEEGLQMTVDYFKESMSSTGGVPQTG
ncbi:MAG: GDP-mannose 4,6-dehydratase [Dehalococcoidia bacterium]|jgi:UDP-glucose 4-epimerase|nr:GDP-mannose 4,6-dehydratase [Dehalococcoidia bacterium]|tara:strand:+ start:1294 stop:2256 length:963 start_codon:yes stop_codon:yes gene_type:complete